MKNKILLLMAIAAAFAFSLHAAEMGTAFTYQGKLQDGGAPANGLYDLDFKLFDGPNSATQIGFTISQTLVAASNGLFSVKLDFGAQFPGDARWLEIWANTNAQPLALLLPRQELTPQPYAIYAGSAGSAGVASAVSPGTITAPGLAAGAVGSVAIADGSIMPSDLAPALLDQTFWKLLGNGGTDPNVNFVGTTDNTPLVLRAYNQITMRYFPHPTSADGANLIGGAYVNTFLGGWGSVICGGGGVGVEPPYDVLANVVGNDHSAIVGGLANRIYGRECFIGGGWGNTNGNINSHYVVIGGGSNNYVNVDYGFIGGGVNNRVLGEGSVVAGGEGNTAAALQSTIGGGWHNVASGWASAVAGGYINTAAGQSSFVGGGYFNIVSNLWATIAGGTFNTVLADQATIGGGAYNLAAGQDATVSGGSGNAATNTQATVGGGINNIAGGRYSTVGGGNGNQAIGQDAVVGGGSGNTATNGQATVGGGIANVAGGPSSGVSGGSGNIASALYSTVGGGNGNKATGQDTVVSGGSGNAATNGQATVSGGIQNKATGQAATVSGGSGNAATNGLATVSGGINNISGAPYSTVGGGNGNQAIGQDAVVSGGSGNRALGGQTAISGGIANTASGTASTVVGGQQNSATNDFSVASGRGGITRLPFAQATGAMFATPGDAQGAQYILTGMTTNLVTMNLLGPAVPVSGAIAFSAMVSAKAFGNFSGGFEVKGMISNYGGSVGFIGTPTVTVLGQDSGTLNVTALVSGSRLALQVTGITGLSVRWVATLRSSEVVF